MLHTKEVPKEPTMIEQTSWIIAAGRHLAKCHLELESTDALTRVSAESWLGVAKADLKKATEQASYLNACLTLEIAQ